MADSHQERPAGGQAGQVTRHARHALERDGARGFRPLTVVALCCVVAVIAVLLTKTIALPPESNGRGGGSVAGAGPLDADPNMAQPTDSGENPDETPNPDSTEPPSTDGGSGGSAPTTPATQPNTQPAPPPAPPAPPAPPPPPAAPPAAPPTTPSVTPSPSPSPAPPVWYEAESSRNTMPGTKIYSCSGCSGGKKVGNIGLYMGTLQFNGVTAATAGRVVLTIAYVNGEGTRTAKLSVNGETATTLQFAGTGGWSKVGILVVTITVKAGSNTLKFYNPTAAAPDFDRITISG